MQGLTDEEKELKEAVKEFLVRYKVLKGTSEEEWLTFCQRHVLREFSSFFTKGGGK